jgi:RNA polymerase sigma-70 factor (ECF subfamily)
MVAQTWSNDYAQALDRWHGQYQGQFQGSQGHMVGSTAIPIEQAIDDARLGNDAAFSALVQQYYSSALRMAQQILSTEEAAADAVQEALIKAHRAMHRFQDGNFRSWLLRIVTNTCYDMLRRQKRRGALSLDEMTEDANGDVTMEMNGLYPGESSDPEDIASSSEGMAQMLALIDELPAWHKHVILLVDVHGYDYGEAAEMLEVPLGTVKSRLSRARATLRDRLVSTGMIAYYQM